MKINFIDIKISNRGGFRESINDDYSMYLLKCNASEDCKIVDEDTELNIDSRDRFLSKTDYVLLDFIKDSSLNVVQGNLELDLIKRILGNSFSKFRFIQITDILAWGINNNKIKEEEFDGIDIDNPPYGFIKYKYGFTMASMRILYNVIHKYIDEYESSFYAKSDKEVEHFLVDLSSHELPVKFLGNLRPGDEDKICLFDAYKQNYRYNEVQKIASAEEIEIFLKFANNILIKDRIREGFLSNVLLHMIQYGDVKKYTIVSNKRTVDDIVDILRRNISEEYEILGIYSDCIENSYSDMVQRFLRSSSPVTFFNSMKYELGEACALALFRTYLQTYFVDKYIIKRCDNKILEVNRGEFEDINNDYYDECDDIDILGMLDDDCEDL